jgi:iron complex outermembrane receptor protein
MGYISYDRGWRGGAPNIAGAPQPPVFGAVDAEDSDNIELGYKWSLWEGRALWSMAVYYQVYSDFQYQADSVEFRDIEDGISLADPTVNVDEAEIYGFDTDITVLLSEQWSLSAALSYTDTELTDAENVPCTSGEPVGEEVWSYNTCNFNGERAGGLPEWSGNLSTEYFQPIDGRSEWYVRALANAESEYYSASEQKDLDSYATLDLFLGWRTTSRNWDVRLWVKNVTDESAELNTVRLPTVPDYANGGETDSGLTWVRQQLNARTAGLTVGYNF